MNAFYERWGGHVVALALHILVISILVTKHIIMVQADPPPETIEIVLTAGFPASQPVPEEIEMEYRPPDAAMTGGEDAEPTPAEESLTVSESEEDLTDAEESPEPDPESQEEEAHKAEAAIEEEEFDPEEEAAMAEKKKQEALAREMQKWKEATQTASSRISLDEMINEEDVKDSGSEFLDPLFGEDLGAVRIFDLRGRPEIIDKILSRYGISIRTQYVSEMDSGKSGMLSRARTNDGEYYPSPKPGVYEALLISARGSNKLKTLEYEAMKAGGYDPSRDRLVKIVFGIVRTQDGYDLGIVEDILVDRL